MHLKRSLLVLLLSTFPASAATAQVALKDTSSVTVVKQRPPKPTDTEIEILLSEPRNRKFEDLCLIVASGGHTRFGAQRGSDLFERMKVDARKCGADAIIVRSTEDQTVKPLRGGIDRGARAEAVAIGFVEEAVEAVSLEP